MLLLLKLLQLGLDVVHRALELATQFVDHWVHLCFGLVWVFISGIIIVVQSDPQLPLKLFDLKPIVLLSHYVTILPSQNIVFNFLIFFVDLLHFDLNLSIPREPISVKNIIIRVFNILARGLMRQQFLLDPSRNRFI